MGLVVKERSEQLGRNTHNLHSAEREHVDRGPGVQQHSEVTSQHTSDVGQDSADGDDLVGSGKSRGELCSAYTAIRTDRY